MYSETAHLDGVEFLVSSPNRLDVLDAISEGPQSRNGLRSRTDASRITLSRVLGDFEDREWIRRVDGNYQCTPQGVFIANDIAKVAANQRAAREFPALLEWFPIEMLGFDLHCLTDGVMIEVDHSDLDKCIQHVTDFFDSVQQYRVVANGMALDIAKAAWEATVMNELEFEAILDPGAYDVIHSNPRMQTLFREIAESETAQLYRMDWRNELRDRFGWEGEFGFQIADETVSLVGDGGLVDTTDDTVWDWARGYFESIRHKADPVGMDTFATSASAGNDQGRDND